MAFLEIHQSLRDHRKTLALADALDMPEPHVAGHCLFLWLWCIDNAEDGVLPNSTRIVERAAGWTGRAGAFVEALENVGMLDRTDDNRLCVHDWDDYAGRLVEKRKLNADRMRAARAAQREERVQERATHVQRTFTARAGATVHNSTLQNTTTTVIVPSDPSGDHDLDPTSSSHNRSIGSIPRVENVQPSGPLRADAVDTTSPEYMNFVRAQLRVFGMEKPGAYTLAEFAAVFAPFYALDVNRTRAEVVNAAEYLRSPKNKKRTQLSKGWLLNWLDRSFNPKQPPQPPTTPQNDNNGGNDHAADEQRRRDADLARAKYEASVNNSSQRLEQISALVQEYSDRKVS